MLVWNIGSKLILRHFLDGAVHAIAGVIDQNVYVAEGCNSFLRNRCDFIRIGDIERQGVDAVWIFPRETRQL
jgi:hypothetical protein